MKKRIALLLALWLCMALVACGNDQQAPKESNPTTAATQPTTGATDPSQAPTEPDPTDPQPTAPQPTEPQPTEPQPTEPQPTEPEHTEPVAPTLPDEGQDPGGFGPIF